MKNFRGTLYVILSAVLYGMMPILVKLAYHTNLGTFEVIFLRSAIAAVVIGLFIPYRKINFHIKRKQVVPLFFCTFFGYTATTITLYLSYNYISSGMATSLLYLYPVLVMLFSFFVLHENMRFMKWFALVSSLVGIYLITDPGSSGMSTLN